MNERKFRKERIETAQRLGWRVAAFDTAQSARGAFITPTLGDAKGYLDLTLVRERVIFAELKIPPNRPTAEQRAWIAALEEADQEVYVWTPADRDESDRILKLIIPPNRASAEAFVRNHG